MPSLFAVDNTVEQRYSQGIGKHRSSKREIEAMLADVTPFLFGVPGETHTPDVRHTPRFTDRRSTYGKCRAEGNRAALAYATRKSPAMPNIQPGGRRPLGRMADVSIVVRPLQDEPRLHSGRLRRAFAPTSTALKLFLDISVNLYSCFVRYPTRPPLHLQPASPPLRPRARPGPQTDRLRPAAQRGVAAAHHRSRVRHVRLRHTEDIALILRRNPCGLQRANALEARIIESGARLDAAPGRATATARRTPRAEAAGPRRVWARGQRYGDQDRPNVSVPVPSIA